MEIKNKNSPFKFLNKFGIKISRNEYQNYSLLKMLDRFLKGFFKSLILKYCMYSVFLNIFNYRMIRPYLWRKMGCDVGQNVFIGYSVWFDFNNANLIEIQDDVHITNFCTILCHERDLTNYKIGDNSSDLTYKKERIKIEKGVMIGMNTTILPGVTIGEGSIIGANSCVTKNIPKWVVAAGNPIKIIKEIPAK